MSWEEFPEAQAWEAAGWRVGYAKKGRTKEQDDAADWSTETSRRNSKNDIEIYVKEVGEEA